MVVLLAFIVLAGALYYELYKDVSAGFDEGITKLLQEE